MMCCSSSISIRALRKSLSSLLYVMLENSRRNRGMIALVQGQGPCSSISLALRSSGEARLGCAGRSPLVVNAMRPELLLVAEFPREFIGKASDRLEGVPRGPRQPEVVAMYLPDPIHLHRSGRVPSSLVFLVCRLPPDLLSLPLAAIGNMCHRDPVSRLGVGHEDRCPKSPRVSP